MRCCAGDEGFVALSEPLCGGRLQACAVPKSARERDLEFYAR